MKLLAILFIISEKCSNQCKGQKTAFVLLIYNMYIYRNNIYNIYIIYIHNIYTYWLKNTKDVKDWLILVKILVEVDSYELIL